MNFKITITPPANKEELKQSWEQDMIDNDYNEDKMTVKDYEKLYDMIVDMSFDAENINLDNFTDEDIEKARWTKEMFTTLGDVPMGRVWWIERETKTKLKPLIY